MLATLTLRDGSSKVLQFGRLLIAPPATNAVLRPSGLTYVNHTRV